MRRIAGLIASLAPLALAGGCAATMHSGMAATDAKAGTAIDGIPYRMPERLTVEIFRKTDEGYKSVGKQIETIADPSKLYVLNFNGEMLADSSLKVEQRQDGTISAVHLTGASKIPETATNAAAGLDAIEAAHNTLAEAEKTKKAAAEAAETETKTKAAATAQAIYDALATKDAVTQLELSLSEVRDSLKPSEIFARESAIRLAKLKANTAAISAGQDVPYPDLNN